LFFPFFFFFVKIAAVASPPRWPGRGRQGALGIAEPSGPGTAARARGGTATPAKVPCPRRGPAERARLGSARSGSARLGSAGAPGPRPARAPSAAYTLLPTPAPRPPAPRHTVETRRDALERGVPAAPHPAEATHLPSPSERDTGVTASPRGRPRLPGLRGAAAGPGGRLRSRSRPVASRAVAVAARPLLLTALSSASLRAGREAWEGPFATFLHSFSSATHPPRSAIPPQKKMSKRVKN
jgi:hypothetical protein